MAAVKKKKGTAFQSKAGASQKKKAPLSEKLEVPETMGTSFGIGGLFALEERIMFDGAALATGAEVVQEQVTQDQTIQEHDQQVPDANAEVETSANPFTDRIDLFSALSTVTTPSDRNEIVFIDTSVDDYQTLMEGIDPNAEVILLDATRDGIEQIAEILGDRSDIDALHIISHGDQGELRLGTGVLNLASMQGEYADELTTINQALTEEADFLVYGCNFGEGDAGYEAATLLSTLTEADVAASTDLTGAEGLGGDWDLEVQIGTIETALIVNEQVQEDFVDVLDITTNLQGHWTFDSTAADSSGNGYDGTFEDGAGVDLSDATDIVGEGKLSLDGSNDYVNLDAHISGFSGLTEGTIAAWVKLTDSGANTIFSISDSTDPDSYAYLGIVGGSVLYEVWEDGLAELSVNTTATVNDGTWHHVAVTNDTGGNKLFIDGQEITGGNLAYFDGNAATDRFFDDVTGLDVVGIGINENSSGFHWDFDGLTDDVRVYDRALTAADIDELFATSQPLEVDTTSDTADGDTSSISALLGSKGADGFISLREAITASNNTTGVDTISFNISGSGPHTINLSSVLPDITETVILDGTTEPDYVSTPVIELNGTSAGGTGLTLGAGSDGSTIRGLAINRFSGFGIDVASDNNTFTGNYIGTNTSGTSVLANSASGLYIHDSDGNTVGGTTAAEANLIGGNGGAGIYITNTSSSNVVRGNFVGTDVSGTINLGNSSQGIFLDNGPNNNTIGGIIAGSQNTIAFNTDEGIKVYGTGATGNSILGNVLYQNGQLGIDLSLTRFTVEGVTVNDINDTDSGANNLQNFPVLTSAVTDGVGTITIDGTLDTDGLTQDYRIEFFASGTADGSGHGEAERYLGFATVTTDGSGDATFSEMISATVAVGEFISATATVDLGGGNYGDTSELAANFTATAAALTVDTTSDVSDGDTSSIAALLASKGADGFISLREAITATNNTTNGTNPDEIHFNIAGAGPHTIQPLSVLPDITDAVILDGTTEPDFVSTPIIELDGSSAGSVDGLRLVSGSDGSTIKGLVINQFGGDGVEINNSDGNMITGNYIGTDTAGTTDLGNSSAGIRLSSAQNTIIGGTTVADRNLISGNQGSGVFREGANGGNVIQGNYIGTDVTGTLDLGNTQNGIALAGSGVDTIGGNVAGAGNLISGNNQDGITIGAGNGVIIQGNYVGTNAAGTGSIANTGDGISVNAQSTQIGGTSAGARNIVSGNTGDGIQLTDDNNTVEGNYIGTDVTGMVDLGNGQDGIHVSFTATNNVLGGTSASARNIIAGNQGDGIELTGVGVTLTAIQGNYIGLGVDGATVLGNSGDGIHISVGASNNTIGGTVSGARNVVAGNASQGIQVEGSGTSNNVVLGNFVGTDATGTLARGNVLDGVRIGNSATANTIGGDSAGAGNLISGNTINGIRITGTGTMNNLVQGNSIGTDVGGTSALANGDDGVNVAAGASLNTIGGTVAGARNIISGNNSKGITLTDSGTTSNVVQGNYIGTDVTGTADLGNTGNGISIESGAASNTIGGTMSGARNVISGNDGAAVRIVGGGSSGNVLQGNYIGVDKDGAAVLGASVSGIRISNGASNTIIGGTAVNGGNIIGGATQRGISIGGASSGTVIQGNSIGTDATGTLDFGNTWEGIYLSVGATNNTIGGTVAGAANQIANNGLGIRLETNAGTGNTILGNAIYGNTGRGIDLRGGVETNGVTANDSGDGDTGPNNLQNFPVIVTAATDGAGTMQIEGTLKTDGLTQTYRIEFFASATADGSGHGEAERYLGFAMVTTDGSGNATISETVSATVAVGEFVTATATVDLGGGNYGDTSEFALNATASALNTLVVDTTSDVSDGDTSSIANLLTTRGADGFISLREAIRATNNTANGGSPDEIHFNIAGAGPHTIQLLSALPDITDAVIIDGTTEPDFVSTPIIELDGSSAGAGVDGLTLSGSGSDGSTIKGLVINQFTDDGIEVNNSDNNIITGNFIGTNVAGTGALANEGDGIEIGFSLNTTIGGLTAADRNVIAGNNKYGLNIWGAGTTGNVVQGNYIGTDVTGTADIGNTLSGVLVNSGATGNTIGGTVAGARNIISGNDQYGVYGNGTAAGNVVQGNYIGTDVTGTADVGNTLSGVFVNAGANGNIIGGTTASARNIISGNDDHGIFFNGVGTVNNVLQGNYIGLDVTGTIDLGNTSNGIFVANSAASNAIGGTATGAGNVISGNDNYGVSLSGSGTMTNVIQGNYIGTDVTGTVDLGNTWHGITISAGAASNTIGGTVAGAGNVISGNNQNGINIVDVGSSSNVVQGNKIGTDVTGTVDLGNAWNGIFLNNGATNNTIGGTATGAGNVISGNDQRGISLRGIGTANNSILGNVIGTDVTGTINLGNVLMGVELSNGAHSNTIGGTVAGARNVIAYNQNAGIRLVPSAGTDNPLLGNQFYANTDLGINLMGGTEDGFTVTANDNDDGDTGPNNLQNFPVLTSATTTGTQITIVGTINSTPNSYYRIEFFSNTTQDSSGHGEAETYLGFVNVATDGSGDASFNATLTASVASGAYVTATATQSVNTYSTFTDTSEFALNTTANAVPVVVNLGGDTLNYTEDDGAVVIDQGTAAVVSDVDSSDFDIGTLTVSFIAGSDAAEDVLGIQSQGNLSVVGNTVQYSGTQFGTFTGGSGGANLIITFDPDADATAVSALTQNITYENMDTDNPTMGNRTVRYVLTDGDGGTSANYDTTVTVSGQNDAPIATDDPGNFNPEIVGLSPLSYWRLGESGGTTVADAGSSANNGTYNGGTLGQTGALAGDSNTAVSFNGSTDYIEIAHDPSYLLDDGSVQLWLNTDSTGSNQALFSKDSNSFDTGGHLTLRVLPSGQLEARLQSTTTTYSLTSTGTVTAGIWHHVALTFGSNGMVLYLDGQEVATDSYTGGLGTTSGGIGNFEPVAIGASTTLSGNLVVTPLADFFDGLIDEVAIFGSQLNADAIQDLYAAGLQYYTIIEDSSLTVSDSEGVLSNDFDVEGDALTASLVTGPSNAAAFSLNTNGSFTYTPVANFNGTDTFTYQVSDGNGGTDTATATITITAVNDAPIANNDTVTVEEGGTVTSIGGSGFYSNHTVPNTLGGPDAVSAADLDGDGDLDVIAADTSGDSIIWYENDGSGNLTQSLIDNTVNGPISVVVGDIDGDGDLDILSGSVFDDTVAWFENDGSQNFTKHIITNTADGVFEVNLADVDGDGDVDVVSASNYDSTIAWYENDGAENFSTHIITNTVTGAASVTTADVDGDGDIDILSASNNDNTIAWYENDGAENFSQQVVTNAAQYANSVTTADIDGDGDVDILAASEDDSTVAWYENDGAPNFIQQVITNTASGATTVVTGDMDGDGDVDVLSLSIYDDTLAWYENDGAGSFTQQVITTNSGFSYNIATGDLDGDGQLDVIATSQADTLVWYENQKDDVTGNDSDIEGDSLTVSLVSGPTYVSAFSLNSDGTFIYTHDGSENHSDGFTYQIDDGNGGFDMATVSILVNPVNDAPVIISNGGGPVAAVNVAEKQAVVTTVTATDADVPADTLTYSITGGADQALFSINSSSGVLTFTSARDFEVPTDVDSNGVYDVLVQVADGQGGFDTQAIAVTVTDVNEGPTITSNGGGATAAVTAAENQTAVTTVTATDVDLPADTLTYSITGGADQALFNITSGGVLSFTSARDFETVTDANLDGVYEVTVQVADGNGGVDTQAISVTVTDVLGGAPPPPPSPDPTPEPTPEPSPEPKPTQDPSPDSEGPVSVLNGSGGGIVGQGFEEDDPLASNRVLGDVLDLPPFLRPASWATTSEQIRAYYSDPLDIATMQLSVEFSQELNRFSENLEETMNDQVEERSLFVNMIKSTGLALSAGIVAWLVRGGALLAWFMASLPAWRNFDPVPILNMDKKEKDDWMLRMKEATKLEAREHQGLEQILQTNKEEVPKVTT